MMKDYLIAMLFIPLLILGMSCSSGGNNGITNPYIDDPSMSPPQDLYQNPDGPDMDRETRVVSQNFRCFLPNPIEAYYQVHLYVPESFTVLKESGYLLGIPKCPYDGKYYHLVEDVNINDPSGFSYRGLGGEECEFSFVIKYKGEFQITGEHYTSETWRIRMLRNPYDPSDAQVVNLARFFSNRLEKYYNYETDGLLPSTPKKLIGDWLLIEDGWQTMESDSLVPGNFKLGIDTEKNLTYDEIIYTGGFRRLIVYQASHFCDDQDEEAWWASVSYYGGKHIPPPDLMDYTPWVTRDTLYEFYLEVTR